MARHQAEGGRGISYGGAAHSGIYHSIYDSYTFYERFLDTGYVYGVTAAQTMATAVLRMADAPLLPFEFHAPARTYRKYADQLAALAGATTPSKDWTSPRCRPGWTDSTARRRPGTAPAAVSRARPGWTDAGRRSPRSPGCSPRASRRSPIRAACPVVPGSSIWCMPRVPTLGTA